MQNEINILILSSGTRNKIIEYFKQELYGIGKVIATDCSKLAPALYEADKYFIVPRIEDENYLETILTICKEENIKGVLSLIDPELSILAKHKQEFLDIGTTPIVSDYDIVELSFDKYKMYKYLVQNGFPTVKTYINKEEFYRDVEKNKISYPVFIKPVRGSASININLAYSKEDVELLFSRFDDLIIQEYMDGKEYGVDVYIDLISEDPVAIFIKEKIKMRAGETDKSKSIKNVRLFDLIRNFVNRVGYKGVIDIDVFEMNGNFYISEVNPRFGGGYPHAYECGVNIPRMILNNLNNIKNNNIVGRYDEGIYMTKYSDVKILKN